MHWKPFRASHRGHEADTADTGISADTGASAAPGASAAQVGSEEPAPAPTSDRSGGSGGPVGPKGAVSKDRLLLELACRTRRATGTLLGHRTPQAVRYQLQIQLCPLSEVSSGETFNASAVWDEAQYPWRALAQVCIDQPPTQPDDVGGASRSCPTDRSPPARPGCPPLPIRDAGAPPPRRRGLRRTRAHRRAPRGGRSRAWWRAPNP